MGCNVPMQPSCHATMAWHAHGLSHLEAEDHDWEGGEPVEGEVEGLEVIPLVPRPPNNLQAAEHDGAHHHNEGVERQCAHTCSMEPTTGLVRRTPCGSYQKATESSSTIASMCAYVARCPSAL